MESGVTEKNFLWVAVGSSGQQWVAPTGKCSFCTATVVLMRWVAPTGNCSRLTSTVILVYIIYK